MDFIFILIALWVVIESILFLLETGSAESFENDENLEFLNDVDYDGCESYDSTDFEQEHCEDDSGVVCLRGTNKPTKKLDKKRQLFLAKRQARRDTDRKIIMAYFRNEARVEKVEGDETEDGYDSDYETSQAELIELLIRMAEYIRWHKIVSLYDLSYKFELNMAKTHKSLEKLQIIGLLQGVCDDRGKFVYVAETELDAVAKFISEQNLNNWPQLGLV